MNVDKLNRLECQIAALKVVVKGILPILTTQQKEELFSNVESDLTSAINRRPELKSDLEQVRTFVNDIVCGLE
ncbi:hypothetical protein [Xenorhabdus bovienii]|uniref:hypothetical protein n=1 Tax=Xenorhabdus bovienii TaxID=40576 RepID=UPI003DA2397D